MSDFRMSVSRCQGQREATCIISTCIIWLSTKCFAPQVSATSTHWLCLGQQLCPHNSLLSSISALLAEEELQASLKDIKQSCTITKVRKGTQIGSWCLAVSGSQNSVRIKVKHIYCDRQSAKRSSPLDSRTGTAWYKCWSRALWDCGPRVPGWPRWSLTHEPERRWNTVFKTGVSRSMSSLSRQPHPRRQRQMMSRAEGIQRRLQVSGVPNNGWTRPWKTFFFTGHRRCI